MSMFEDEEEDPFEPYEYSKSELDKLCEDLRVSMSDEYSMGQLNFYPCSIKAKPEEDDDLRIECQYKMDWDDSDEDRVAFVIKSYVENEPLEDRIYDKLVKIIY